LFEAFIWIYKIKYFNLYILILFIYLNVIIEFVTGMKSEQGSRTGTCGWNKKINNFLKLFTIKQEFYFYIANMVGKPNFFTLNNVLQLFFGSTLLSANFFFYYVFV